MKLLEFNFIEFDCIGANYSRKNNSNKSFKECAFYSEKTIQFIKIIEDRKSRIQEKSKIIERKIN